jgi:hypothetical protein
MERVGLAGEQKKNDPGRVFGQGRRSNLAQACRVDQRQVTRDKLTKPESWVEIGKKGVKVEVSPPD